MREVNLGKIYRHFKGGLYIADKLALHSEDLELLVIYTSLETNKSFARPHSMFLDEVPEGKENPTGQKYRLMSLDELEAVLPKAEMDDIIYKVENLVGNK